MTSSERPENRGAAGSGARPGFREDSAAHPHGSWRDGWYVFPHHVVFRDLDAFGHVNNAVFFTYFEWARAVFWFELFGWAGTAGITFIVARAECDFRRQLAMEPIELAVRVGEMRNSSFDFEQQVRTADGAVAASGRVVVVLYDWARQSKVEISDELRRRLRECNPDVS